MRILYLKIIFNIRLGLYRIYLILKININIFLYIYEKYKCESKRDF